MKRFLDLMVSMIGLAVLSPLLVVIAGLIKMEDGGPVLYGGTRVGFRDQRFKMLKFRSMVNHADKIGGPSTPNDDPRLTKIGRWLRKSKLDELPQLMNVLRGEMSLVGPRPEVPHYVEMFTPDERSILSVRPGITDWASLWNSDEGSLLAGSLDPERTYMEEIRPKKIQLQLKYVKNHSLGVDLQILFLTFRKLLTGK